MKSFSLTDSQLAEVERLRREMTPEQRQNLAEVYTILDQMSAIAADPQASGEFFASLGLENDPPSVAGRAADDAAGSTADSATAPRAVTEDTKK